MDEIISCIGRSFEYESVNIRFKTEPEKFLKFAKGDLNQKSSRGRVNALSNAKRSIECRMDEIIWLSNLKEFCVRERWNIPEKMTNLREIGSSTPSVLQRLVTSKRNLLEHQYIMPDDQGEIENIVDIAELYLQSTKKYIEDGYIWKISSERCIIFNLGEGNVYLFDNELDFYKNFCKKAGKSINLNHCKKDDVVKLMRKLNKYRERISWDVHHGEYDSWESFWKDITKLYTQIPKTLSK